MPPWPEPRLAMEGATLRVQSVLYKNGSKDIALAAASVARAADFAIASGRYRVVELVYGDCSDDPCLSKEFLDGLRSTNRELAQIKYEYFGKNLGSAGGHNRLLTDAAADWVLILNPDVRVSPRTIELLSAPFARPTVGITEARQLPIEHPKEYDPTTGETSWASTACAMIPLPVLRALGGFDADQFFLYCDDVDLSWRVRLLGQKVIYVPAATVFHDKRLSRAGKPMAGVAESYYSAEAALLLTWKWSRPDLTEHYLNLFDGSGDELLRRAAAEFRRRKESGQLPSALDPAGEVAQFVGINYAKHRFTL
jgi:GT2 family glycosyltransferase